MLASTGKAAGSHVPRPAHLAPAFQSTFDPKNFLVAVRTSRSIRPNTATDGVNVCAARPDQMLMASQCCGATMGVASMFSSVRKPTPCFAAADETGARAECTTASSGDLPQALSRRRKKLANRHRVFMEGCAARAQKR